MMYRSKTASLGFLAALLFGVALPIGCAETTEEQATHLPSKSQFPLVLDALERRCGTLDCHGAPGRNLRLYTGSGLRLSSKDIPGNGQTTPEEYDASYWSVYGLEPEVMSAVIGDDGADPLRLLLLQKARGMDHHRPGAIIDANDAADKCIRTWLKGTTSETACKAAAAFGAPGN
ncbi:MAG: hypothetical protein U0441_20820 [Polyangiaceae bacterium]